MYKFCVFLFVVLAFAQSAEVIVPSVSEIDSDEIVYRIYDNLVTEVVWEAGYTHVLESSAVADGVIESLPEGGYYLEILVCGERYGDLIPFSDGEEFYRIMSSGGDGVDLPSEPGDIMDPMSFTLRLGGPEATDITHLRGMLGIGTDVPTAQLHTTGTVRLQGVASTSANTRILTMDTNGNLRYRNPGGWTGASNWYLTPSSNIARDSHVGIFMEGADPDALFHVRSFEPRMPNEAILSEQVTAASSPGEGYGLNRSRAAIKGSTILDSEGTYPFESYSFGVAGYTHQGGSAGGRDHARTGGVLGVLYDETSTDPPLAWASLGYIDEGHNHIGVYSEASNIAVYAISPQVAGFFDGAVEITHTFRADGSAGTTGQVLTSNGMYSPATWETIGPFDYYEGWRLRVGPFDPYLIGSYGEVEFAGRGGIDIDYADVGGVHTVTIDGTGISGSHWTLSGGNVYRPSGRVGINTTSPSYTLDVNGDLRVNSTTYPGRDYRISCGARQQIYANNDLVEFVNANKCVIVGVSGGANDKFYVAGETEDNKIFTVEGSTRSVGINTTSPEYELDVLGNVRIRDELRVEGMSGSGDYIMADSDGVFRRTELSGILTGTGTANYVAKWTSGSAIGNSQIFDNGTNVGIGTTSPSVRFQVQGNLGTGDTLSVIRATPTLYTSNNVLSIVAEEKTDRGAITGLSVECSLGTSYAATGKARFMAASGAQYIGHGSIYGSRSLVYCSELSGFPDASYFSRAVGAWGYVEATEPLSFTSSQNGYCFVGVRGEIVGSVNNSSTAPDTSIVAAIWGIDRTTGAGNHYAGYFDGDVHINGNLSKSSGTFKIDHPLDPENKYLYHSFVESPDMMNIYNGNAVLDNNGEAIVELPEYFAALNTDYRYQLTCIGGYAQVYIAEKIHNNQFKIAGGNPGLEVSWQVTGIRNDPYARKYRIQNEVAKETPGEYLHPELFSE